MKISWIHYIFPDLSIEIHSESDGSGNTAANLPPNLAISPQNKRPRGDSAAEQAELLNFMQTLGQDGAKESSPGGPK